MLSDDAILKVITSSHSLSFRGYLKDRKNWIVLLHHLIEWSFPTRFSLWKRIQKLSQKEKSLLLCSVNQWRTRAQLRPISRASDRLLQSEIAHLAKLKAFQLSRKMAQKGTPKEKRSWILISLKSDLFLEVSKKTFLGDECLDRILGLDEKRVKAELLHQDIKRMYQREDIYLELDAEDLFTPYRVLAQISQHLKLKPRSTLVDLGSGLGRVAIVMAILNPKVRCIGLELMKERHSQAEKAVQKLKLNQQVSFHCCDLAKSDIPLGDFYYLFNPFSYLTLRKVFNKLALHSRQKSFQVILAQVGRPPRMAKKTFWLKPQYHSPLDRNWRAHGFSRYRTQR